MNKMGWKVAHKNCALTPRNEYNNRKGGAVPESRRKFRRFDLPLIVKFRPTYGATDYSGATALNLSCGGLGLDAYDFRFILYENLELIVGVPVSGDTFSLFGDIVWKKQVGKRCLAGIKFKKKNKILQEETIEKILVTSNIPASEIYGRDPDYSVRPGTEKISPSQTSGSYEMTPEPTYKLGFIKQYHDNGNRCKVTFRLLREAARNTRHVRIVGDFNNWDASQSPMTRLGNGDFVITIDLPSRKEYRYRYLIDGSRWENDWYADKFVLNEFGSKDSVVIV